MNKTEIPAAVSAVVNGWYFGDYTADEICTVASMTAGEAAEPRMVSVITAAGVEVYEFTA